MEVEEWCKYARSLLEDWWGVELAVVMMFKANALSQRDSVTALPGEKYQIQWNKWKRGNWDQ